MENDVNTEEAIYTIEKLNLLYTVKNNKWKTFQ